MRSIRPVVIIAMIMFVATSCRSVTRTGPLVTRSADGDVGSTGARSNVVKAGELVSLAGEPLDQAIRRIRPEFLRVRMVRPGEANQPSIYVDERYAGAADVLRSIPIGVVSEIAYLTPIAARNRYGSFCPCAAGVLAITTQRQD